MGRCGTMLAGERCGSAPRGRGAPRPFAIDIEVTKARAHDRARELASELLPNGREEHGYWRTGSIADDPGQSLAVTLSGPDRGMWVDYAASGPEAGGNLIQLAALTSFGGDVGKALKWLNSRLGLDSLDPDRLAKEQAQAVRRNEAAAAAQAAEQEKKRRRAQGLYLSAEPIEGSPAESYLKGRGIDFDALGHRPGSLAFHGQVWNVEARRKLPCMLAAVVDMDGRHIATHRTWLAPDGRGGWTKADLEQPKKVLGAISGGFIPLWKGSSKQSMGKLPEGSTVYCSEGIEDGLTAALARPELRVIAAVSLSNIGALRLPATIGRLVLVGQRDTHPKTLEALERAIARQQQAGRAVWITPPPGGFKDVNEALCAGGAQ